MAQIASIKYIIDDIWTEVTALLIFAILSLPGKIPWQWKLTACAINLQCKVILMQFWPYQMALAISKILYRRVWELAQAWGSRQAVHTWPLFCKFRESRNIFLGSSSTASLTVTRGKNMENKVVICSLVSCAYTTYFIPRESIPHSKVKTLLLEKSTTHNKNPVSLVWNVKAFLLKVRFHCP